MSASTTSATSMNFVGFDEMQGNGTSPVLYNRVVIMPGGKVGTPGRGLLARAAAVP